jgi:hypothetical protein
MNNAFLERANAIDVGARSQARRKVLVVTRMPPGFLQCEPEARVHPSRLSPQIERWYRKSCWRLNIRVPKNNIPSEPAPSFRHASKSCIAPFRSSVLPILLSRFDSAVKMLAYTLTGCMAVMLSPFSIIRPEWYDMVSD